MQMTWRVQPADSRAADQLAQAIGVEPLTAQLLLNRGLQTVEDARAFLSPSLAHAADPNELPEMPQAIERLRAAIATREPILLFGDSDVDGLTAGAILYETLHALGAQVSMAHANRIANGYGISSDVVQRTCASSITLVVLIDCGTNQADAVDELATHGIDTIIVDHHLPLDHAAHPHAMINPFCTEQRRFRELSSAGLALKVAQALWGQTASEPVQACLDLAALGLLADYAPLVGEARLIVHDGLSRIVDSHRPGLRRLCQDTETSRAEPDAIVKGLVPRLNASGRLGDPSAAWQVLVQQDEEAIDHWMGAVKQAHDTTRQLHRQISGEAQAQIARLNFRDQYVLMVSRSGWHQGLMGPLASQLAKRYGRPTIAIAMDEHQGTGSGRSIPLFNLLEALRACQSFLVRFGGHAQACGLTVDRRHLESFRALVNQQARLSLGREGLVKTELADLELSLGDIRPRWVEETGRFAPFGNGNPRPTVIIRHLTIDAHAPRAATVSDGTGHVLARGHALDGLAGGDVDVMATPTYEEGNVVLTVRGVKASSAPS